MKKEKVKRFLYIIVFMVLLAFNVYFVAENYTVHQECKTLYEKEHLSSKDLKSKSVFNYSSSRVSGEDEDAPPEKVKYKKLYGVEYIGQYEIEQNGGIDVKVVEGNSVKILVLDENGKERFYKEATELSFEPNEAGKYDVYLVGYKFTGKVEIKTY